MKTPIDYLATEWKILTRTELSDIPENKFLTDILEGIRIMIGKKTPESHVVAICKKEVVTLRNLMINLYF